MPPDGEPPSSLHAEGFRGPREATRSARKRDADPDERLRRDAAGPVGGVGGALAVAVLRRFRGGYTYPFCVSW